MGYFLLYWFILDLGVNGSSGIPHPCHPTPPPGVTHADAVPAFCVAENQSRGPCPTISKHELKEGQDVKLRHWAATARQRLSPASHSMSLSVGRIR